jgi:hypothetical protein
MYKGCKVGNPLRLLTCERLRLAGGERGESVPVKLAILYVRVSAWMRFCI